MKISINQIITYSYVKYDRLAELINFEYKNSKATKINLYIDLYSILKPLYSSNIAIDEYNDITSSIINMCSHYRSFFKTRYNVDTRIYLIWSSNLPSKNKNVYKEYNQKFEYTMNANTKITKLISDNLELLSILCPYIPEIMYVTDLYEVGVIAQYIQEMQDNISIPALLITRDPYNFQLAKESNNIKVLVPYKQHTNNGTIDSSYIVNEKNALLCYLNKLNVSTEGIQPLSSDMLSILMALSRCPTRNILSLYSIPKAYKFILNMIESKFISNSSHVYDISPIADATHTNINILKSRYYICDIQSQLIHYRLDPAINVRQSMINLYDANEVKNINNKYFINNPLDLNRL